MHHRPGFAPLVILCSLLGSLAFSGCALTPRVPVDVSRAVVRDDMRVVKTQNVDLYYPAKLQREAYALAERLEGCVAQLRQRALGAGGLWRDRVEVLFPDLPFNNAFVMPPLNGDFFSVVPTHWTVDASAELGLPPGPDYVACHEMVHYVHMQQTLRTWGGLNKAFGYVLSPQLGLDAWFTEGLATYYEQVLSPGTGRPSWPVWRGLFHAAVAGKGVSGGDLSAWNRRLHVGNHYEYGSHFIAYLVETYGERKLWELIERQGKSFFFPFIVNQRFKRVYGKTLSQLIDDFSAYTYEAYPERARPTDQRTVRRLGTNARYARAPDGSEAIISEAMDDPPMLSVWGASGELVYERRLTEVFPQRALVYPSTGSISGLRFTADGARLYFVAVDQGLVFQEARLMELDVHAGKLRRVTKSLAGFGGDIRPDGREYLFVRVTGRGHALVALDVHSGSERVLYEAKSGVYLSSPSFSPDGRTIVLSRFAGAFSFALFDARTGRELGTLSSAGERVYDATFIDDDRLLFVGEHQGRFQVYVHQRSTNLTVRLSDAPYLALHPRFAAGSVRFLNREGTHYTLDEIPLPGTRAPMRSASASYRFFAEGDDDAGVPSVDASTGSPEPAAQASEPLDFTTTVETAPAPYVPPAPAEPAPPVRTVLPPGAPPGALALPARPAPQRELLLGDGPPTPLPAPYRLTLAGTKDRPYSAFPRVLIPSVRAPLIGFASADGGRVSTSTLGLYLGGTDALGQHRWGASFGVQPSSLLLSGGAGYLNAQLAPLLWMISASQLDFEERRARQPEDPPPEDEDDDEVLERKRQRDAALALMVPLRTSVLGASFHLTEDYQPQHREPSLRKRTLSGATLSFGHTALESTPMTGPRRGFALDLSASYYPEPLGTLDELFDLRSELWLFTPLPFSSRHTLALTLRARGIIYEDAPLLEVGGATAGNLWTRPGDPDVDPYPGLPAGRRFREPLRGFETRPFAVERIAMVDLRYRYPIIIDRGTATSLWILPSFFFRQLDIELFAVAATETFRIKNDSHVAVGGAITARFVWLGPIAVGYQLSRRLSDDRALQHLLTLTADLAP